MTVATVENAPVLGQFAIAEGDTLIVTMHPNSLGAWQATALNKAVRDFLAEKGQLGLTVLVVPPDCAVDQLDPEAMRRHGWVREGSERKAAVEDFAHFCTNRFADGTDIGSAPVSYYESLATEYLAED